MSEVGRGKHGNHLLHLFAFTMQFASVVAAAHSVGLTEVKLRTALTTLERALGYVLYSRAKNRPVAPTVVGEQLLWLIAGAVYIC